MDKRLFELEFMFYCEQMKIAKRRSDPLERKEMVGKDVGVRSFLCKPGSGEAKEPLLVFFFPVRNRQEWIRVRIELMGEVELLW